MQVKHNLHPVNRSLRMAGVNMSRQQKEAEDRITDGR